MWLFMALFMLVHGGSHGAWCWDGCADELQRQGHGAIYFDLPGHGQDATPRAQVTLESYARLIRQKLEEVSPKRPVVVGHSLAGVGLAEALSCENESVRQLILVAGLVLKPGERAIDRIPESRRPSYFELAEASNDRSFALSSEVTARVFFNDLTDKQARYFHSRLTPQPLSVYLKEIQFDLASLSCPKSYLSCARDNCLGLDDSLFYAERLGGSSSVVDAGHDVMLSSPKLLAQKLIDLLHV